MPTLSRDYFSGYAALPPFRMDSKVLLPVRAAATVSIGGILVAAVVVISLFAAVRATTNDEDVYALNELYIALNSPSLTGWTANGGDPCAENWQGVACAGPNITRLTLSGLYLTSGLGSALENLTALIVLDLSSNNFTGGLPFQLPPHVQELILSANQFIESIPLSLSELSDLVILNFSSNMFSGSIPDVFDQLVFLTTLDLSNNGFDGSLPPSFGHLTSLNELFLQNNQFMGTIDVLANLPLKTLDVSNNNFSGWIPSDLKNVPSLEFTGNSFNTFPAPPPPPSTHEISQGSVVESQASEKKNELGRYLTVGRLAGLTVAALLMIAVAVLVVLFYVWKNQDRDGEKHDPENSWQGPLIPSWKGGEQKKEPGSPKARKPMEFAVLKPPPVENYSLGKSKGSRGGALTKGVRGSIDARAYTIAELQAATQSFDYENLIGDGTIGKVYKAELSNGEVLAVKKLDYSITREVHQDFLEFLSRISRLRHENVAKLEGYCVEHGEYLLVYEYIGNGTLFESLHFESERNERLPWMSRVNIALGVAKALEYLHESCEPAVVHHKVTSSNILLDDDFNPHLSDCGLASLISLGEQKQASAEHLEFSGYSAFEHSMSGTYTIKSDVYSFGVVMLELLTGRKPLDRSRPHSEQSLVRWAVPQLHDIDALAKMVDPVLNGTYPVKSVLSRFADIIVLCVQPQPEFRPAMSEVTQSLVRLLQW